MSTEFRSVAFCDDYRVGDDGSVWSRKSGEWKPLAQQTDREGYRQVALYRNGVRKAPKVHRLVLEAFVGPPSDGQEGCHKDGNPSNNAITNLYWGTPLENHADKRTHGTVIRGDEHPRAKVTAETIATIIARRASGSTMQGIADELGVGLSSVSRILNGKQRVAC